MTKNFLYVLLALFSLNAFAYNPGVYNPNYDRETPVIRHDYNKLYVPPVTYRTKSGSVRFSQDGSVSVHSNKGIFFFKLFGGR